MKKINLKNLSKPELEDFVLNLGLEKFRAQQLFHWMYQKNVVEFSKMTTLKNDVRERFDNVAELNTLRLASVISSKLDPTRKFLFKLSDGQLIESVYMEDAKRKTICLSSQVGCALGCEFCATGQMGFRRNLTVGEIVDQVLWIERYLKTEATNIVMMGMGEPFLNYDAVIQAAEIISDPEGISIGKRKITISTSGIIPGILRFTKEKQKFKLAISLNATTEELRKKIMPITKKYSLKNLLQSVKKYTETALNKVTFEYLLIKNLNDSLTDARRLRNLLGNIPCKINLIPYNSIDLNYSSTPEKNIELFFREMATFSAPVTIRRSKGQDIQAACGQLYTEFSKSIPY